jgi:hypothetical protein
MKKLAILGQLFLTLSATVAYAQDSKTRPEVGQYCKVYIGDENLQITTVRLGKEENKEALLEVVGIDHPFDNKIFKVKVKETDNSTEMVIQWESKDWVILTKKTSNYGSEMVTIYLPNKGKKLSEYNIYYTKELSGKCRPEYILTAFLQQKK